MSESDNIRASGGLDAIADAQTIKAAPERVQDTPKGCAICLEELESGDSFGHFDCPSECNVKIHGACARELGANTHSSEHFSCPICRKPAALWLKVLSTRYRTLVQQTGPAPPPAPVVIPPEHVEASDSEAEAAESVSSSSSSEQAPGDSTDSSDSDYEPGAEEELAELFGSESSSEEDGTSDSESSCGSFESI